MSQIRAIIIFMQCPEGARLPRGRAAEILARRSCSSASFSEEAQFFARKPRIFNIRAEVSRAGARTGLQLQGHVDTQGFDSSSLAECNLYEGRSGTADRSTTSWVSRCGPLGQLDISSASVV